MPGVSSRHDNILRKKGTILFLRDQSFSLPFYLVSRFGTWSLSKPITGNVIDNETVIIALNYTLEMGREDQLPMEQMDP